MRIFNYVYQAINETEYWSFLDYNNLEQLDPTTSEELAEQGMVEVNAITKKGPTGKRTQMKYGKFIGKLLPDATDKAKETFLLGYQLNFRKLDLDFHVADKGFVDIVTMKRGREGYVYTSAFEKYLSASCMRYSASKLGLNYHPYEAYESGDFKLAYATKDGKLFGRVLLHPDSKTNSAFYGVCQASISFLRDKVREMGYVNVDYSGEQWEGAKLKFIQDTYIDPEEYEDDSDVSVVLAPYLDFWESGYGYVFKGSDVIILLEEEPDEYRLKVDMQNGSGFDEI